MTTLDVQESIVKALKFIQFICVCALLLILTLLNKFSSVLFLYIFIHRPLLNTVQLSAFLLSASTAFIVENCSPHQIINPIKDESTPQMNKYKCLLPPWLVRPFHSWIYEPISWDTLKMLVIYMIPHSTEQTLEKSNAYRISRCRFLHQNMIGAVLQCDRNDFWRSLVFSTGKSAIERIPVEWINISVTAHDWFDLIWFIDGTRIVEINRFTWHGRESKTRRRNYDCNSVIDLNFDSKFWKRKKTLFRMKIGKSNQSFMWNI